VPPGGVREEYTPETSVSVTLVGASRVESLNREARVIRLWKGVTCTRPPTHSDNVFPLKV